MAELRDKLSIYIPQKHMGHQPIERLMKLANDREQSINYLVVRAIMEFLEREEKR